MVSPITRFKSYIFFTERMYNFMEFDLWGRLRNSMGQFEWNIWPFLHHCQCQNFSAQPNKWLQLFAFDPPFCECSNVFCAAYSIQYQRFYYLLANRISKTGRQTNSIQMIFVHGFIHRTACLCNISSHQFCRAFTDLCLI